MATDREGLLLQIEANLRSYEKELARAQKTTVSALRKIEKDAQASMTKLEGTFAKFGKGLASGFAAAIGGVSLAALGRSIKSALSELADIGDRASQLGVSTDQFQQLAYVSKLAGVEVATLAGAMKRLAINTSDAARGTGSLHEIFKANGVEIVDQNGNLLDQTKILEKVAGLVRNASSEQDKAAIANAAFGRTGVDLLVLLKQGADGVRSAMAEAAEAGITFSAEQIEKAGELDDRFDLLIKKLDVGMKSAFVEIASIGVQAFDDIATASDRLGQRVQWIAKFVELFKELDAYAKEYGPFSDRAQQGNLFGGQTVNRSARGDRMSEGGSDIGSIGGQPTVIPPTGGSGGGKGRSKASGPKNRTLDAFQREVQSINEAIAAYRIAAQAIGLTAGEVEKLETQFELLNAAQRANVQVTPEVAALIAQLASQAGNAAQKLEEARKKQDQINEINSDLRAEFTTFFSDMANGVKPIDALTAALGRLQQKLLDLALNSIFDNLFGKNAAGGGIGGFISSFFQTAHTGGIAGQGGSRKAVNPMVFAGAPRFHGGGLVGGEVPIIAKKGEFVLTPPQMAGLLRGRGGGANVDVRVINNTGERVQQRRQQGVDGRQMVEIVIGEVKRQLGNGQMDGPLAGRFGIAAMRRRT